MPFLFFLPGLVILTFFIYSPSYTYCLDLAERYTRKIIFPKDFSVFIIKSQSWHKQQWEIHLGMNF